MIIEILAISLVVLCGLVILFICFKKVFIFIKMVKNRTIKEGE